MPASGSLSMRWSRAAHRSAWVGGDARVPGDLVGAEPAGVRLAGEGGEVGGVPVGEVLFLAEFRQPHGAVLAQGVEHPVAVADRPEDGLGAQAHESRCDVGGGERAARADGAGVDRVDLAPEDGEPGPEEAFEGRAQFVAPPDGGAQSAVAVRPYAVVGEYVEPGGQPLRYLLDGVVGEPGAGEFDGQRDAFEAAADRGGGLSGGRVVEGPVVRRAVAEEAEGVLVPVQRERCHFDAVFAPDAERRPAGGQHGQSGGGGEQVPDEVRAGPDEAFAAVEYEQQIASREPFAEGFDGGCAGSGRRTPRRRRRWRTAACRRRAVRGPPRRRRRYGYGPPDGQRAAPAGSCRRRRCPSG